MQNIFVFFLVSFETMQRNVPASLTNHKCPTSKPTTHRHYLNYMISNVFSKQLGKKTVWLYYAKEGNKYSSWIAECIQREERVGETLPLNSLFLRIFHFSLLHDAWKMKIFGGSELEIKILARKEFRNLFHSGYPPKGGILEVGKHSDHNFCTLYIAPTKSDFRFQDSRLCQSSTRKADEVCKLNRFLRLGLYLENWIRNLEISYFDGAYVICLILVVVHIILFICFTSWNFWDWISAVLMIISK